MDLPVPSHLKEFLVLEEEPGSEYEVTGNICCTCGSMYFEILENNNKQVVKLICCQCKKEILLFDISKHGWNGFVCDGIIEEKYLDRKLPLQKYYCPVCKEFNFKIIVTITSQGKQDFIEECLSYEEGFSASDWVDAFESISIIPVCAKCGFTEESWAVFETM